MGPWVVSAVKFGASALILSDMVTSSVGSIDRLRALPGER
jgi:hypothetical protein